MSASLMEADTTPFLLPTEEAFVAELARTLVSLQDDIHRSCCAITRDVKGARLGVLQRLSLKRSSAHAAFYKSTVLAQARLVQRQRSDLVKLLQRQARQLLSTPASHRTASPKSSGRRAVPQGKAGAPMFAHLESILALVQDTMGRESARTEVRLPLCPSLATLHRYVRTAVVERALHERVMAAVFGPAGGGGPANDGEEAEQEEQTEGPAGGGRGATKCSRGAAAGDAALREALHLLFECMEKAQPDAPRDGGGAVHFGESGAADESAQAGATSCGPCVRVPVLLSLAQYLSDAPWCTTHDALGEEERRRRIRANPGGDEDPTDRIGFLFTRRGWAEQESAPPGKRLTTAASGGARGEEKDSAETTGLVADALHLHAQAVSGEVAAAVDALWTAPSHEAAVERVILRVLRGKERGSGAGEGTPIDVDSVEEGTTDVGTASPASDSRGGPHAISDVGGEGVRQVTSAEEERQLATIREFLDVVRVLYSVELSSRVLALTIAGKLLTDSEDFICFDGLRSIQLCVGQGEGVWGTNSHGSSKEAKGEAPPLLLPVSVFNLPDTESVFYCTALTVGLALLRDYHAYLHQPLEESGHEEEEAALRWERLGLTGTAALQRQRRATAWLSTFEAQYLTPSSAASVLPSTTPPTVGGSGACSHQDRSQTPGSRPLTPMFASSVRLWHYLWEHVFHPLAERKDSAMTNQLGSEPLSVDGEETGSGEEEVVEVFLVDEDAPPSPSSSSLSAPTDDDRRREERNTHIPLSRARARRWLETQVRAAVTVGVERAALLSPGDAIKQNGAQTPPLPRPPAIPPAALTDVAVRIRRETLQLWRRA